MKPWMVGLILFLVPFLVGISLGLMKRRKKQRRLHSLMGSMSRDWGLSRVANGKGVWQSAWFRGERETRAFFVQCRNLGFRGPHGRVSEIALRVLVPIAATRPLEAVVVRRFGDDGLVPEESRPAGNTFEEAFGMRRGEERLPGGIKEALLGFVREHRGGLALHDRAALHAGALPPEVAADAKILLIHDVFQGHLAADEARSRLEALLNTATLIERHTAPL